MKILSKIKHRNVLGLYDFFEEPDRYVIVTEFVVGGTLLDRIVLRTSYVEKDARDIVTTLLRAFRYIHSLNVVHRDLKVATAY